MKTNVNIKQNIHLITGAAAAGLALALPRRSKWKLTFVTVAAIELGQGLWKSQFKAAPADQDDVAAPETEYRATVDGIEMRWEEHGDSSEDSVPVVMVHGIPTHPRLWRYVIPKVSRVGVRCFAWGLVGFGWSMSEGIGRDISVARQAEYLYAWLNHQGIKRAVFVGHDLGGGVLQELLTRHPELCQGLVLADCVAYANWPVTAVRMARAMEERIEKLPPQLVKPFFLAGLLNLGHDNAGRLLESIELHWKPYARAIGPKAFANQLRHLRARDTMAVAGKLYHINAPAHVVWGEADALSMASGKRLATELGATFTRIQGGRHFTPEDHPGTIAAAINTVLQEALKKQPV